MSKKWAFIFPGQGAQYVGMMKDFYDTFSEAKEVFSEADDILKWNLTKLVFEGPSQELTQTKNSQVAIFVASCAVLKVFEKQFPEIKPTFSLGLSLGEYTALVASQKVSFANCLPVVAARGVFMNDACEEEKGTLNVVLGMEPEAVEAVLKALRPKHRVWIANLNCPGQVVIAGDLSGILAGSEALKTAGAKRVLPLDVSGAFHSELMESARVRLEPMLRDLPLKDSICYVIMNVSGQVAKAQEEIRENLISQVTCPVLWESSIQKVEVDAFIEMGPGKTLAGMNKRIGIKCPTFSIEKVGDLEVFNKEGKDA